MVYIKNDEGKVIKHINISLKVEIRVRDILEMIVDSSILAVPVAFTDEVQKVGERVNNLAKAYITSMRDLPETMIPFRSA